MERGDIYYADLGQGIGSEQEGRRPVVIIQNDIGNKYSPTVIVAPLTSSPKKHIPTHVTVWLGDDVKRSSTALLEQLRTLDKSRLEEYLGRLSEAAMQRINRAVLISTGLYNEVIS